ncbi:DUF3823 domain-containing protein [Phocaeicola sp.]
MKKITYYLSCLVLLLMANACVDVDNYDAPAETIVGRIIDKKNQKPMQTEVGDGGVRLKLLEMSWSDNPTPYYTTVKQDGTYQNTKIFKGNYIIEALGAFVPTYIVGSDGKVVKDERWKGDIKGTVNIDFEIEPFLNVEWVGEPTANADGTVSASVKITRGTDNADYQKNLADVYLFINSSSPYVGDNNKDSRYSVRLDDSIMNDCLDKTVTLTTPKLPGNRKYYVRVGARIDHEIDGRKRYNYNEPKGVMVN